MGEEAQADEGTLAKLADYAIRGAKDFGRGVFVESVPAIARGLTKELPKRLKMAADAPGQAWLDLVVRPALKAAGGPGSEEMVDQGIQDLMVEMRKAQEETGLDLIGEPETGTGWMIQELAVWAIPVSKSKSTADLILGITKMPKRVREFLRSPVAFGIAATVLADPMQAAIDEAIAENPDLEEPIRAAIEAQDNPTLEAALERIEQGAVGTLWGIGGDLAIPVLKFGVRVLRASGRRVQRRFGGGKREGGVPPLPAPVEPKTMLAGIQAEEGYVYHVTNLDNLNEIADSGTLRTHRPNEFTDQDAWPDGSTQKRSYFGTRPLPDFAPSEGQPVVVRLKRDKRIKTESTGDLYASKEIPASELEYLGVDDAWHPVSELKAPPVMVSDGPDIPKISEEQIRIGDPNKPKISLRPGPLGEQRLKEARETIQRIFGDAHMTRRELEMKAQFLASDVELNLENLRRPEDIKELMLQATKIFREMIEKARRGTRSQDLSEAAAKDLERRSIRGTGQPVSRDFPATRKELSMAVIDGDGRIYVHPDAKHHVAIIEKLDLDPDSIVGTGFVVRGRYYQGNPKVGAGGKIEGFAPAPKPAVSAKEAGLEDVKSQMEAPGDRVAIPEEGIPLGDKFFDPNIAPGATHADTQAFAKFFGMGTVDDLVLEHPRGAAYNAEETLAAVMVWSQAARILDDIVRQSDGLAPSGLEQVRFRRALAAFGAISAEIMGIRAEAGRALNIWGRVWKTMGGDAERAMVISRMLEEHGGQEVTAGMMRRYAKARKNGLSPRQIGEISAKGALEKTIDAFNEHVISGYLWLTTTHLVNMMSPYIILSAAMSERAVARQLQKVTGLVGEMAVAPGEPEALLRGAARGLRMMLPAGEAAEQLERAVGMKALEAGGVFSAAKAFFSLYSQQLKGQAAGQGIKLEDQIGAIHRLAEGMEPGLVRSALDFYGSLASAPGHALIAEDLMSRGVMYEASREALALRHAHHAGGTADEIAARYAALVADPPEALRAQAIREASDFTFTGQAGAHTLASVAGYKGIFTRVRRIPILGPLMVPFVNVLANMTRDGIERTPMAFLAHQWRGEIAKGGAARDIALAKAVSGTLMMGALYDLAESGMITGRYPSNPGQRKAWQRMGKTDYSAKFGNHWVRLQFLGPLLIPLALAGTLYQILQERELDGEDTNDLMEILSMSIKASESVMESQTTAKGVAMMIDAIRRQDESLLKAIERGIQSTMPASTLLRFARRATDPTIPDVNSAFDAVLAQIAIFEKSLPRVMDLHGYIIQDEEEFGRGWALFSLIRVSRERGFPIDREMYEHNMEIDNIRKKTSFAGVPVNFRDFPRVFEAYVELAGHGLVLHEYGSRVDYLNEVVSPDSKRKEEYAQYQAMTPGRHGQKRAWVKGIVETYNEMAQQAILYPNSEAGTVLTPVQKEALSGAQFDEFRQYVEELKKQKEAASAAGVSR
jgi:hypothetical protein